MRTDLTTGFLEAANSISRKPRLLMEFYFEDETVYISDQTIGIADGLLHDYIPIVESWGRLKDNANDRVIYLGDTIESRQLTISILNSGTPPFSSHFRDNSPENVYVNMYVWFYDTPITDIALVDRFIVQDPITISERSMLVALDLVSVIMRNNPYMWGSEGSDVETRHPVVVGKVPNMPASSVNLSPISYLVNDLEAGYIGLIYMEVQKFFTESGKITIDSEIMDYIEYNQYSCNITARGVDGTSDAPHNAGALICSPDDVFDYNVCAGPVTSIDNVLADGNEYTNDFEIFEASDPAYIRFVGRPPWHDTEEIPGTPIPQPPQEENAFGNDYESNFDSIGYGATSPGNINNSTGNVTFQMTSDISGDQTALYWGADWGYLGSYFPFTNGQGINDEPTVASTSIFAGPVPTGEILNLYSDFGRDLTSLGSFRGLGITAKCSLTSWRDNGGKLRIRVNDTVVYELNIPHGFSATYLIDETLDISSVIGSWSELASARVSCEFEATSYDPDGQGQMLVYYVKWYPVWQGSSSQPIYPWQDVVSHFNRDWNSKGTLISAKAIVRHQVNSINCTMAREIVSRVDADPDNNYTLWSDEVTTTQGWVDTEVDLPIGTWEQLMDLRIGLRLTIIDPNNPGDSRSITAYLASVIWVIEYQPDDVISPSGDYIIYSSIITCDVVGNSGEFVTPAHVIENLLTNRGGHGNMIDSVTFDKAKDDYALLGYYFNGYYDGGSRLHDALKEALRQGMARLLFNAGLIKLVPYYNEDKILEMAFTRNDIRIKAITERRQNADELINDFTAFYDRNPATGYYREEVKVVDENSIELFDIKDNSGNYFLVVDESVATLIANTFVARSSYPMVFTTFEAYFKSFPLEKEDYIQIETSFNEYFLLTGHITTIERIWGSGKLNIINSAKITVVTGVHDPVWQIIDDQVQLQDTLLRLKGIEQDRIVVDQVNMRDEIERVIGRQIVRNISDFIGAIDEGETRQGGSGYGANPYGYLTYGD